MINFVLGELWLKMSKMTLANYSLLTSTDISYTGLSDNHLIW